MIALILMAMLQQENNYETVSGRATVYYPSDGHCGSHRADGKPFRADDSHIAHRTLSLGTTGYLCSIRSGLCVRTSVRDRGPFGAVRRCDQGLKAAGPLGRPRLRRWGKRRDGSYRVCFWWQAQIKLRPGWRRRGAFDLTRPVARAIKHKAFDRVVFFYKKRIYPDS